MVKKQESHDLKQRVRLFAQENQLLSGQSRLLVAVSGGQDSVCLLHLLVKLREELNIELHVAHLDHCLRGADAEADARYVSQLAGRFGIPVTIEQCDVKEYQARHHASLEEAAREVRYTFLSRLAKSLGIDCVAVGHTADDHIETVLMHLIRGTGSRGLRGLQPITKWRSSGSNLTVIRPLLPVSRQETANYCLEHELKPRNDVSNQSLSLLRNRIRLQLLPLLRGYNPGIDDALLRTAQTLTDDVAFIDEEIRRLWSKVAHRQGGTVILEKSAFLELPRALQRHLLRAAIGELLGNMKDIEACHIEEIMAISTKPPGKRLNLPDGLVFVVEYQQFLLTTDLAALSPFPVVVEESVLKIPGETVLPGWRVQATVTERQPEEWEDDNFVACFDYDKVGGKVVFRSRQDGDRFQPLGMSQPKKLGEFMIDAKIPRNWRQQIPVVCSPRHILWVVGWRIDDRVKVTESTGTVLRLECRRVINQGEEGLAAVSAKNSFHQP